MRRSLTCMILALLALPAAADSGGTIVIRPSDGPSPERRAAVRRWIGGAEAELEDVVAAWARARRDLERWPRRGTAPGCGALARAVPRVDAGRIQPAPDLRLGSDLAETVWRLGEGAESCLTDRYFDASYHLEEAMKAWLRLARGLRRYGIEPATGAGRETQ
ncbi:MAG: hypothetical protein R2991_01090 [Thermoanaerobaculia bacterium]